MPTHHAAHHEHTMNVIVVLVWLWICICINICICICIFLALAERAGRAAAASTQPTLSQIHLCRKHFFSASSFSAITSSFFLFLHLTFQLWWNILFILSCFLGELSLFNVNYLVLIFAATLKIFCIFSSSQATNLMIFKFILLFSLFFSSWLQTTKLVFM